MWLPRFACPDCRAAVLDGTDGLSCVACGQTFACTRGIYRFLSMSRQRAAEAFLQQYRLVRARDGYRAPSADYYRMLPVVARHDPRAAEWRIRRESYVRLQRHALPAAWESSVRVLDLGAGSGWLSHRLAGFGMHPVAVDRLDDEEDGLGACRHYPVSFPAVQADFDALPFAPGGFDLVVLNGSLHYSSCPEATLAGARRMLAAGGTLVVMDSPMFDRDQDGQRMLDDQRRTFAREYGLSEIVPGGSGFLTFAQLNRTAETLGLKGRFFPSRGPAEWRLKRQVARWRLGRAPASFGVWVGR